MNTLARIATFLAAALILAATLFAVAEINPAGWRAWASLALSGSAVVAGCGLAVALAMTAPRFPHPSLPALLVLALSVAGFVASVTLIDPLATEGGFTPVERLLAAGLGAMIVLVGAALSRLAITFPRVIEPAALEASRLRWNQDSAERRRARLLHHGGTLGRLKAWDARANRALARGARRVLKPGAFRDDLLRLLEQDPEDPRLQPLSSWLGLPWSGWRWAAALLPAVVVAAAVLPPQVPILIAALGFVILAIHGIIYFVAGHPMLDEAEQRRARWIMVALLLPSAFPLLSYLLYLALTGAGALLALTGLSAATAVLLASAASAVSQLLMAAIPLVIVTGLAIAVFWDGAIDPGLVVRETAVYGLLSGILLILFTGMESVISDFIALRFDFPDRSGGWMAGVVVALLFTPARNRLERRLGARSPAPAPGPQPSGVAAATSAQDS